MTTSQVRTRKRPAPGASPLSQSQSPISPTFPQDPTMAWDSSNTSYTNPYGLTNQSGQVQQMPQAASNQLTRRLPNQPIVPITDYNAPTSGTWQVTDTGARGGAGGAWQQSDDLDQRASVAKKDAEAKRKQIPPFIQKLSSFLDESRNTELIRWSESGDSFIVLDEDAFAKTLIPELFKHSNYASFVRQLNMYGFHKKVGLSDNSMRASERKNKNPSEYSNPYFKRGRPNLLWLIQKPKNTATNKNKGNSRGKQDEFEDDVDETFGRDMSPLPGNADNFDDAAGLRSGRQMLTLGNNGPIGLPQEQLIGVQQELKTIRENQKQIAEMLNQVRKEHQHLYGQAKAFHDLHSQHDNSINAILQFLASVYNRNLNNGQGGMGEMFSQIPPNNQNSGAVFDIGDQNISPQPVRPYKRPPLLLQDGKISPVGQKSSPLKNSSASPRIENLHSPTVQELSDHSGTPSPGLKPQSSDNSQIPQADIMSLLNSASQKNTPFSPSSGNQAAPMDFTQALSHLQNSGGNTPLTPGQRQNMLQLMGDEYRSPVSAPASAPNNTDSNNTALGPYNANVDPTAQLDATSSNLDQLGHFIREQGQSIDTLSNTLTPLSPSGSIPGINSDVPYNINQNPDFDFDSLFNSAGYFDEGAGLGNGGDRQDGAAGDGTGAGASAGAGAGDFNFDDGAGNAGFDGGFDFGDAGDFGNGEGKQGGGGGAMGSVMGQQQQREDGLESPGKRRRVG